VLLPSLFLILRRVGDGRRVTAGSLDHEFANVTGRSSDRGQGLVLDCQAVGHSPQTLTIIAVRVTDEGFKLIIAKVWN
jgi:hypothetical protein